VRRSAKLLLVSVAWAFSLTFAAQLVGFEMGVPSPRFDPADLKTYRIAEARNAFGPTDPAILFVLKWRFKPADVGPLAIELYLIPPKGELVRIAYTLKVPSAWVGRTIATYAYYHLTPEKIRARSGTWVVYFLANGELKGTARFELNP